MGFGCTMIIAAGLVCDGMLVMASDCQLSSEAVHMKLIAIIADHCNGV